MEEAQLTGRIVTPHDPEYEQARINHNLSVPRFPKIIVFCQHTQDVVNALNWVREKRMPFRVRSGRHSYENFSLVNGGLIIDVSEMNRIKVDRHAMTAKIEAGAALGNVYRQLWKHGATIPAGTESSVGLVGLTLGGEAVRFFDEPGGNEPANRKRSGSFITAPLPLEAILTMKQWLAQPPNEHASLWHQSLGGAAAQIRPEETAYYYRDAIIAQEYLTRWNERGEERRNVRWIKNVRQALSPYTTGDYVNWPDRSIRNWPKAYYGENFPRLREVKTAYDPMNLFRFPQSIPPYRRRG
ncbi:FAD-dependent oxidoreductase [Brevibacillus fluminis]|uniref:FAD-dependent oxidoreductase n=1 Tax=Brevibacillus fluminis TaxID=511487 RepID=UPI003F8A7603